MASLIVCGGMFCAFGFHKAAHMPEWESVLERQGLIGRVLQAQVAAPVIAAGEVLLGVALIASATDRRTHRSGLAAAAGTFVIFSAYAIALTWVPPARPAPCGCGFSDEPVASWGLVAVRNAVGSLVLWGIRSMNRAAATRMDSADGA